MSNHLLTVRNVVILHILKNEGSLYTGAIQQRYEQQTGSTFPRGGLYTTLNRMEAQGLVKSRKAAHGVEGGGNRRRYFTLTPRGRKLLEESQGMLTMTKHGSE